MAFVRNPLEEPEKSLRDYASPWCEDIKVQESDLVLQATRYEIKPQIIEMAATNPFWGVETDNPYRHIQRFMTLCNTVRQEGVPNDWFKWNLFPYSLTDEEIKWYSFASFEVEGNWDQLIKKFCASFWGTGASRWSMDDRSSVMSDWQRVLDWLLLSVQV
jgi:hypothetical protein